MALVTLGVVRGLGRLPSAWCPPRCLAALTTRHDKRHLTPPTMARQASTGTNKTKIELYYDVTSPFSWYAFEVLHRYKSHWDVDLHLKPVLLADIIKTIGTTPEMLRPKNPAYHLEDIRRCARYFNVPLRLEDKTYETVTGKDSLPPNLFLTAVDLLYPGLLEQASRELWMSAWSKHEDITSDEVLAAVGLAAGLTPEAVAEVKEHTSQPATKQRLEANTKELIELRAFGVPTIFTHTKKKPSMFFGSDRFHLIARDIGQTWKGPEPDAAPAKLASPAGEKKKVVLYYDVISPYAWFGFEVLTRYQAHWNIDLHLKPVLLMGVGKAAGTIAPAMKPNRAPYMTKDLFRTAAHYNVPLKMPEDVFQMMFVKGSLIPSRFLTAISLLHPSHLEEASRQLWLAVWGRDEDITTDEVLTAAGLAAGLTPEAVAEAKEHAIQPAIKEQLRAHTAEAAKHGAFGVPTILACVGEKPSLYFGSDRFPLLAQELNEPWLGPEPGALNARL